MQEIARKRGKTRRDDGENCGKEKVFYESKKNRRK